jgi:hypothetical protein
VAPVFEAGCPPRRGCSMRRDRKRGGGPSPAGHVAGGTYSTS